MPGRASPVPSGEKLQRQLTPRPFLKWVGGKGQLLNRLVPLAEKAKPFRRYHEPFVGGAALFFELYRLGELPRSKTYLSDNNDRLMTAYRAVAEDVDRVIELLHQHKERHCKEHYYAVRARVPDDLFEQGARIIYMNRTCFNGLFRENSRGEFNVPMGRYKNPMICDAGNLRSVSEALRKSKLETRPFETVLERAEPGDFVYFDPPYHPLSKTSSFTAYAKGGFGEPEQRSLAMVFQELDRHGVNVVLSNSMTPLVRSLYQTFNIRRVPATRRVNSRADRRGAIDEALVTNF
jgi:DNA adenine methylase